MLKVLPSLALILTLTLSHAQVPDWVDVSSDVVLVVYNENDNDDDGNGIADSKDLALYYQQKRNIPAQNLLGLNISISTYFYNNISGWQAFWDEMLTPIRDRIDSLDPTHIKYILMCDELPYDLNLQDTLGYSPSFHNRRSIDHALAGLNVMGTRDNPAFPQFWFGNPIYELTPTINNDLGPFNHDFRFGGTYMYLVGRLMAEDHRAAINQIDMALYGDKYISVDTGYYSGMAYVDNRYGDYNDSALKAGYPYAVISFAEYDKDAAYNQFIFEAAGFQVKLEPNETEIGDSAALYSDASSALVAPDALLYGGWYNFNKYHDGFWWLPGSVACDLNSNSAARIRSGLAGGTFLSGSFARGLTCGTGVITEPYLTGHNRSDILFHYFLKGYNFIEAAWHAEPKFKWQSIMVGDPLYNPFRPNKPASLDQVIQPVQVTFDLIDSTQTDILLNFYTSIEAPEVVKAQLLWGLSSSYTDTIPYDPRLYFAHHRFSLIGLDPDSTYHFRICVIDPVGNTWCSSDETFTTGGSSSLIEARFEPPQESVCLADSVYFINTSSGNNSFSWLLNGNMVSSATDFGKRFNVIGTQKLQLIANNGSNTDTFTREIIVYDTPRANFSWTANGLDLNFTDSTIQATTWNWSFGNGDSSSLKDPSYTYDSAGTYLVCQIVGNPCGADTVCKSVTVIESGIAATSLSSIIDLYPNPAQDYVTVRILLKEAGPVQIRLRDMLGQEHSFNDLGSGTQFIHRIDLTQIPRGMWMLEIRYGNEVRQLKLIKT